MSVLRGVIDADGDGTEEQEQLNVISKKAHLMMMAGATLQGAGLHAQMINEAAHVDAARGIVDRLDIISANWVSTA
jgi:hypothetical protein